MKKDRVFCRLVCRIVITAAVFCLCSFFLPEGSPLSLKPQSAEAAWDELSEESGSCGPKATWTFDKTTGVVTISGSGRIGGEGSGDTPFYQKNNITKVVIGKGITEVGRYMFYGCSELKEAVLPDGIKVIDYGAFQSCASLSKINLPNSITSLRSYCFSGCSALKITKIPSGVEVLESGLFAGTKTTSFTVPGTVKKIDYHAFYGSDISEIVLEEGLRELGQEAFNGCKITTIHLPASLTDLRSDSLESRSLLDITVDAKNSKYSVKDGVLYNKYKSTLIAFPGGRTGSFTVPKGVVEIGSSSFMYTKLDSVTFPDSVTKIGAAAFRCSSIKTVNIPKNVSEIGLFAFDTCTDIEGFDVSSSNKTYADIDGVLLSKDLKTLYRFPSAREGTYVVPESVTVIDRFSFDNCSLTHVVLPRNLKKIGDLAFRVSDSLKDIVIPESVTELEMNFFSQCSAMERVVILSRNFTEREGVYNLFYFPAICQIYGYEDAKVNGKLLSEYIPEEFNGKTVNYVMNPIKDISDGTSDVFYTVPSKPITLSVPKSFGDKVWVNSDPTVATITSGGKLTPQKGGLIDVFATNDSEARHYRVWTGFSDVEAGTYYYDPVYWAYENEITYGVLNTSSGLYETFRPQGNCTRAQMATFLWRMADCPEPEHTDTVFTDVRTTDYFYKAVLWGEETGIIKGYADNTFRPQTACTRQQAATFLWRFYDCPEPVTTESGFGDVKDTETYFYKAVLWAAENHVTEGYPDGTFKPTNKCTRAQMVTFLYRSKDL